MKRVAIIRCEKNMDRCPLTNCLRCLTEQKEGFAGYDECVPAGIFTCRCPGDNTVGAAKILKAKGAETIHFCTCSFAQKADGDWVMKNGGFCDDIDAIIERVNEETGITCVKGTAHLPEDYIPKSWVGE
jgi:predicted metal-binding protein